MAKLAPQGPRETLATLVKLDPLVAQDLLDLQEILAHKVELDLLEHADHRETLAEWDHKDLTGMMGHL